LNSNCNNYYTTNSGKMQDFFSKKAKNFQMLRRYLIY